MTDEIKKRLTDQMEMYIKYMPEHMHYSVRNYLLHRIKPGSFFRAVLENNLKEAVGRADATNYRELKNIIIFVVNGLPSACQGSPEKVEAWLAGET